MNMTESYERSVKGASKSPDTIKPDVLEAMEYQYRSKRDILITIRQPEYSSVCPMTGLRNSLVPSDLLIYKAST